MLSLIIANLLGLIDNLIFTFSSKCKDKESIFRIQIVSSIFGFLSYVLLKGYTGVAISLTGPIRNFMAYKDKLNKKNVFLIVLIQTIGYLLTNTEGIFSIFPLIASASFSVSLIWVKNKKHLCVVLAINNLLWMIYNLRVLALTSAAVQAIGATIAFIEYRKEIKLNS